MGGQCALLYRIRSLRWAELMDYAVIEWRDGQPYSKDFDDVYFSVNDGRAESEYVFLQQNDLAERFSTADKFVIAETGFGTGLNFALTLKCWQACAPADAQLDYFGIDFSPLSPEDILRAAGCWPELAVYFAAFLKDYPLPVVGRHLCSIANGRVRLHLVFMDVAEALENETLGVDAWFLDGFSPPKNPQIWNQKIYSLLAQNSAPSASLATYSAAGAVRRGLAEAGFAVEKRPGHGNKREMLVARFVDHETLRSVCSPWYAMPRSLVTSKHAVVLGAGLAGLAVAWSLIKRGWTITLVDKHTAVAQEASGNAVGLVLPRLSVAVTHDARFYSSAFLHAVSALNQLQTRHRSVTGNDIWCGDGVYSAMPEKRAQRLLDSHHFHADYLRQMNRADTHYQIPPDSSVLWLSQAGWASPAGVCAAMLHACGDSLCFAQATIASIQQETSGQANAWKLLSAEQDVLFESEHVVLANGTHVTGFPQTQWLPVSSARGQLTELVLKNGTRRPEHAYSAEQYLAPALNAEHSYYCGASYHLNDDCVELRAVDQQSNFEFVEQCCPGIFQLADGPAGRVGFRAVSDDRLPIIGPVPDVKWFEQHYSDLQHGRPEKNYASAKHLAGLYVSAAHGSRGITSCFLAGEVIAAQIENTPLPVESAVAAIVNPARFIIRRLKRGV